MSWWRPILGCGLLLGGCDSPEQQVCDEVCDQLVTECSFAAYPDRTSCMDGCLHSASEGAPVLPMATCMAEAECDPFEVVACSRQHAVEP